jgi:predicted nucleic acid-binding protein
MVPPEALPSVVVDTSLAIKWVLTEADTPKARALLGDWQRAGIRPIAPSWFACEVSNVLFQSVRSGTLSLREAQMAMDTIIALVQIRAEQAGDARRAIELAALAGQRATYDCQFAALAERLGCELWTADGRFRDAIRPAFAAVRLLSDR